MKILFLCFLAFASPALSATLKVTGDSTLHKWSAMADSVSITAEMAPGKKLKSLSVKLAAGSLKSNEGSSMDKNMYKALETAKYPEISFEMKSYELAGDKASAKGVLSIHGVSKEVELIGKLVGASVEGKHELKMSDYGIKSPVMMLGTLRVRDKVTIHYEFGLE